jgi:hypothetical protein
LGFGLQLHIAYDHLHDYCQYFPSYLLRIHENIPAEIQYLEKKNRENEDTKARKHVIGLMGYDSSHVHQLLDGQCFRQMNHSHLENTDLLLTPTIRRVYYLPMQHQSQRMSNLQMNFL